MPITTINPATGEEQPTELEKLTADEVERKLAKAEEAFHAHRRTSMDERAAKMRRAGDILADEKETFARLMTMEMGKTFKAAIAEAEKCAWVCRFYADHAAEYLADEVVETDAKKSYVRYLPLGPVLA
ncbi:MAG TPA: aldehyde dehydrogenase family protein, partial [Thermoanaerobaculia bacterium]|nr:aldehyde dehydrogenase family protein [Thermoanaerobaculia bacterium]